MLSIIVACDLSHAIGLNNQLPWHLPQDLAHFKKMTMGCPIVMGRKTFQSIGRPLPGRDNWIISRQCTSWLELAQRCHDEQGALTKVPEGWLEAAQQGRMHLSSNFAEVITDCQSRGDSGQEIFVIGGAELYALALPMAERVYLTRVQTKLPEADAWFPGLGPEWEMHEHSLHPADEKHQYAFECQVWELIDRG